MEAVCDVSNIPAYSGELHIYKENSKEPETFAMCCKGTLSCDLSFQLQRPRGQDLLPGTPFQIKAPAPPGVRGRGKTKLLHPVKRFHSSLTNVAAIFRHL